MKILTLIVALLFLAGCVPQHSPGNTLAAANELVFRDASGNIVGSGSLWLPKDFPANGKTFEGAWHLTSSTPAFPSQAVNNGNYEGRVDGQRVSINLNPGVQDDNVVLSGLAGQASVSGEWYFAAFSGGKKMGTFTITP